MADTKVFDASTTDEEIAAAQQEIESVISSTSYEETGAPLDTKDLNIKAAIPNIFVKPTIQNGESS